jgi:hypothetical protein
VDDLNGVGRAARRRQGWGAVVVILTVLAATAPPAGARKLNSLGPAPGPCQTGQTSGCTFDSRCAQMSFSPHLVHVGEEIDSTAGPAVDACGPGGVAAIGWSWGAEPGLGAGKGPCASTPLTQPSSCRFKAVAATTGWQIGCINGGSGFGPWTSCDYYAVIGAKQRAISGRVLTKHGKPVSGATITIDGPTGGSVTTTANGDYYADELDPGQYIVAMRANGARDPVSLCSGHEVGPTCHMNLEHADGQADFTAPPDTLAMHFSPSHIPADGLSSFSGTIDVSDSAGQPSPGTAVEIAPPAEAQPRALVCSGGKVVYPQIQSDGSALGSAFTLTTDGNGQIPLTIWAGTVPGHLFTQASETTDTSVNDAVSFPLDDTGAHFPALDGFAQLFYNLVRNTQANSKVKVFVQFNQHAVQPEGDSQDILLQLLIASGQTYFPGADFGPVSYAGHAGIVFYPHGSTDPTAGPTVVLDMRDAVQIATAAAAGDPIPAANAQVRSLADWAMYVSGSHTPPPLTQTLGPLAAWTGQQYAYFGFPYPRSPLDAAGQARFYNACAAPQGTPQIVQTHSPVSLVFSSPTGTMFGLDARGQLTGDGTGIVWRQGDQTTYLVRAGSYSTMNITGTGNGTAHIDVFGVVGAPLTSYARQISNYVVRVRNGATGALPLNFFGPAGTMSFAGRIVKPQIGLPMQISGLPRRVKHGRHRLTLTVTSFSAPLSSAVIKLADGRPSHLAATDRRGRARFTVKLPRGRLKITVTFPGAATLTETVRVR